MRSYIAGALYALMLILFFTSCASREHVPQQGITQVPPEKLLKAAVDVSDLPSTYMGVMPCADCDGIRYQLNLLPDGSFILKRTYMSAGSDKKNRDLIDSGRWQLSRNGTMLLLDVSGTELRRFTALPDRCMRMLDSEGGEIKPGIEYTLCRKAGFVPLNLKRQMRGLYSYMADVGLFTDCETGKRYPVAAEGDNAALERAYLNTEHGMADPRLVRFEGRLAIRPPMEGSRMDEVVIVERFLEITSDRSCSATVATSDNLENTRWKLVEISGETLEMPEGRTAPGFRLNPTGNSLRGFCGCNRMMGTYRLKGAELHFGSIATTRKFCADSQGLEDRFLQALGQVKTYSIKGDILELYGDDGLLATFKADTEPP